MVEIKNKQGFADDFLLHIRDRFGKLNKNDYEVLMLHLFGKYSNLLQKNTFSIATELKIPEAKIKRLVYESKLVYGETYNRENIIKAFYNHLNTVNPVAEGKVIKFVIQDKYLRTAIQSELISMGFFMDGSFNGDVVAIHYESLMSFIAKYYEDKNMKYDIEKNCKKALKIANNTPFSWTEVAQRLASSAAEKIPSIILDLINPANTVNDIVQTINKFFK